MEWMLEYGLIGVIGVLWLSAVGLPVPEEVSLATAGVLAGRGHTALSLAVAACYLGVLAADLFVWRVGRTLGSSQRLRDLVGPERFERLSAAYERYGGWLVLIARPVPGLRVPVYLIAGAARMPASRFVTFDAVAAAVTVPLYVGAGFWMADDLARLTAAIAQSRDVAAMVGVGAAAIAGLGWLILRQRVRATDEPEGERFLAAERRTAGTPPDGSSQAP